MPNRTPRRAAALLLAASLTTLLAAAGLPHPAAAATCTAWTSETQPPATIRVFRSGQGTVETVDFRSYVKNVLSREWISSWTNESVRAGALAVRTYAWYQVVHYRGYVTDQGACFDVFDTTRDQVYDPARPTYGPMTSAVDATWATLVLRAGHVFPTYYNAGAAGEGCGANPNGWKLYQWGSQACGLAGRSAAEILAIYYAGVSITAAPPPSTPAPSPTAVPTPIPTTVPTPTSAPTATPPTPPPTPVPTAPPPVLPGGGQSGVVHASAPPPPPSPDLAPIIVTTATAVAPSATPAVDPAASPAGERSSYAMRRVREWPERAQWLSADPWPADRLPGAGATGVDARLVTFRHLFGRLAMRLAGQVTAALLDRGSFAIAIPVPR